MKIWKTKTRWFQVVGQEMGPNLTDIINCLAWSQFLRLALPFTAAFIRSLELRRCGEDGGLRGDMKERVGGSEGDLPKRSDWKTRPPDFKRLLPKVAWLRFSRHCTAAGEGACHITALSLSPRDLCSSCSSLIRRCLNHRGWSNSLTRTYLSITCLRVGIITPSHAWFLHAIPL